MVYLISMIMVVLGVALDQYTKYLATLHLQDSPITIIKGIFQLQYLENSGAAFGMLQNQQLLFLIVTTITLVLITYLYIRMPIQKRWLPLRICIVLLVIGAIGNMIDRIRFGYVVDFFYIELIRFPIFNVADIFATLSIIGCIVLFIFYYKDEDIDLLFQMFSKKKETQE